MLSAVLWLGNISFEVIDNENHVEAVSGEGKLVVIIITTTTATTTTFRREGAGRGVRGFIIGLFVAFYCNAILE